jgi:glucose/arabinose dehydrogenase
MEVMMQIKRHHRPPLVCWVAVATLLITSAGAFAISSPPGYHIGVLAYVPAAREMAVCGGTLFVGTKRSAVYAVPIKGGRAVQAASGLVAPNGVACQGNTLYVASRDRISAFTVTAGGALVDRVDIHRGLPPSAEHSLRYIGVGPDGRLYISLGSPCNICQPQGLQGTIASLNPNGGDVRRVAWGIRNSVGFDWNGATMYFTDNGADGMGDNIPPDELNKLQPGGFYGFPFFGGRIRLPGFETAAPPATPIAPIYEFQAHVATLGIHFYQGSMFPELRGEALIAEHGSWDRSVPVGYEVVRLRIGANGSGNGERLLNGIGRPVDVKELPDGSIVVSDDTGGRIWRISRNP